MNDPQIKKLIEAEKKRQKSVVNLIASENYVSEDVLDALGSEFTNKYSEGHPGKRYYGGNEVVDKLEELCQRRALELFGLNERTWSVNVQPLSGAPANLAVYSALMKPGDKLMGMKLSDGGHLSHGHKVSITGQIYKSVSYTVDPKTEKLDYEAIKRLARKERPKVIVAGFTAYPRKINWKKFRETADSCGAYLLCDISHIAGLVAAGEHPSPFKYADVVTTTTHKTLRGPRAAIIFSKKVSSKQKVVSRKDNISELIDKAVFPGLQGGPHLNQIAAVAVALKEAKSAKFGTYIKNVVKNAQLMVDEFKKLGWRVVSGGTDTHLLLVDVWDNGKGITGGEASDLLEKKGIIVNKNTIPFDTRSPFNPSGIRIGTAAETTRGKSSKEFVKLVSTVNQILRGAI
jgi:glycine hydroxymethyltransferase